MSRTEKMEGWSRRDWQFMLLLVLMGAFLLLSNLGNMYLWQDEAETALLSQRLLEHGLPMAFDGRNLIRQAPKDIQYTADFVWVYHPWLPFFFTALSFAVLGPTTFAARLPYALAGLGTALLLYLSARRCFRDRRVAQLAAPLLLLCVPFLLHSRQCKYFAFAALFSVAVLDAYLYLRHDPERRFAAPYFVLSGFCLFQSNFGAFVPLMLAVGVHFLLSRPSWKQLIRFASLVTLLALFVLPWAVYLQTWARGRFAFDVYRFVGHLVHYAVYITGWVWPLPLALLFVYLWLWKRPGLGLTQPESSVVLLYVLVVGVTLLFLSETFLWIYFSYIVQLVPLLMVLLALTLCRVLECRRSWAYAILLLLIGTNVLHLFPWALPLARQFKWASLAPRPYLVETDALIEKAGQLRFDAASYAYELTHDYDDPNEGIALFLRQHAAAGDVVLANYGELPIAFYTGLDIAGGLSGYRLEQVGQPEWVINRRDGPYRDEVERVLAAGNYEVITIPYPDLSWGNRPVPEYHKFRTVTGVPSVTIYRRMD